MQGDNRQPGGHSLPLEGKVDFAEGKRRMRCSSAFHRANSPPCLKGGGFGFAKTGGILSKLPADFNGMGLTPFRPRCGHLPSRGGKWLGGIRKKSPPCLKGGVCEADGGILYKLKVES